ncbi:patatin-domain-containing protein [Ramicandelaber brevisporus]|nr:patatin-domain-containing protein [Ramicandelaber brevisporus]
MNNEQQQQQQQPFSKPESATTSLVASVIDATVRLVVSIFSYTVTLSVRVPTLGTLALLIAIAGYAVFRYNLLTVYSRLPKTDPPPSRSDRVLDLQPDIAYEDILGDHGGFSSNLFDAFLSSIRVFGSLDEPVFHELSRHLQTRRLLAGDTMSEEEVDASFYIVVEGRVEVYLATPTSPGSLIPSEQSEEAEDGLNPFDADAGIRPRLLNVVRAGERLSSMFAILSLFTNDISLDQTGDPIDPASNIPVTTSSTNSTAMPTIATASLGATAVPSNISSPLVATAAAASAALPTLRGLDSPQQQQQQQHQLHHHHHYQQPSVATATRQTTSSVHPDIVIRAAVDTTLAVIPAEAFRKLTRKFPGAAACIVQAILARFQRGTHLVLSEYFGLPDELVRTMRGLQSFVQRDLPDSISRSTTVSRLLAPPVAPSSSNNAGASSGSGLAAVPSSASLASMSASTADLTMSSGLPSAASLTGLGVLDNNSSATPTSSRLATRRRQSSSAGFRTAPTEADLRQLRGDVFDSMSTLLGMSSHASSTNGRRLSNISTGYGASPAGLNTPTQMSHNRSSRRIPSASGSKPHLSQVTNALNALPVLEQVDVELLQLDVGTVIMESGSRPDGLYYVVAGRLEAYSSRPSKSDSLDTSSPNSARLAYAVTPGGLAGYFESLTDMPAVVTVRSVQPTIVGFIPKSALERLSDRNPTALLLLAKRLISRLSSLALHIDFAIEWVQVEAGQVIYRQGDSASAAYIVASGRLRAIHVSRGPGSVGALHIDIRGEYGQGESLGELEVLTGGSRLATLHAIRDSEVARMPHSMFDALAQRYPVLAMRISRVLATRAQKPQSNPNASSGPSSKAALAVDASRPTVSTTLLSESGDANYNLRTIALVPTDASVPIAAFAQRLHDALVSVGASVAVLDYRTVIRMMGRHTFSRFGELRLLAYLAELEQRVSTVLYVADSPAASPWTKRCIRQADCVLLVANGDSANQEIGAYERVLLGIKTTARKELVLLHGERLVPHGSTRAWLQRRVWIHAHHHVHMPLHAAQDHLANPDPDGFDLVMTLDTHLFGGRVRRYYTASRRAVRPVPRAYRGMRSDFARLARRLTGQSVGVVLSGGGARGMAHIGMLRAMEDAGVPVDMIGGTSIGSFMGGLYAGASDSYAIMRYARMFAQRTASMWRQALDLTYPVTAMLTGHELNRSTWKVFADTQIEDLWLPYFCVTTNITHSRAEVHQTGYLWRYVRASMTLAGYMPPLCDNGNMLVDGGYLDNMPVGIMRSLGAKTIIAIDVSRQDDTSPHDFGDSLSGFRVLASRWNPFRWLWYYPNPPPPPIPDLAEIQSRLAYVSSVRERDLAIRTPGCLYIRVPIQQYATLEFGKFQEILDKGHAHGKRVMKQWEERGILNTWRPKNTAHLPHIVSAQSAVDVTRPRSNNPIDAGKQSTLRKDVGGDGYRPTSPISAASNTAGLSSANMEKWREPLRGRRNSI